MKTYTTIQYMQNSNEDMLLSQEEINKIAERISKDASERLTKELERALKLKQK